MAGQRPGVAESSDRERAVLAHWRSVVEGIPGSLTRRLAFERFAPVRPDSVLARYLNGAPILTREHPHPRVFPFAFNLSQRQAVEQALTSQISVVEGGPSMGKTQTIVNIVANLLATSSSHVAVVSADPDGLADVRERFDDAGVAFVIAELGTSDQRQKFFANQAQPIQALNAFLKATGRHSSPEVAGGERLRQVDDLLARAQWEERRRADLRADYADCQRELERFLGYVQSGAEVDLSTLPRLAAAAPAIAEGAALMESKAAAASRFLAIPVFNRDAVSVTMDASEASGSERGRILERLQGEFYRRRLSEMEAQLQDAAHTVEKMGAAELVAEHLGLSTEAFEALLRQRYAGSPRREYASISYWKDLDGFLRDYPVLLSTAGTLAESLSRGAMLDTVIVDAGSQLDLATAATLLACAKHVVVVGDGEPFTPTPVEATAYAGAPQANVGPYDFRQHSLLSSLGAVYGPALPRTVLRVD